MPTRQICRPVDKKIFWVYNIGTVTKGVVIMAIKVGSWVWLNPGENFTKGVVASRNGGVVTVVTTRGATVTLPISDVVLLV